jgi:G:T/U-mismatch repair DNA glycosylase
MLLAENHPFNQNIGLKSISTDTKKLIVGTFPAYEVVNLKTPRLNFYYGSKDNKFWDIVREVSYNDFEFTTESILHFLLERKIGIIDIIERCYRKGNRSSSDDDLSIIEALDIVNLIQLTNCRNIYTTSKLVTNIIKKQLKPIVSNLTETVIPINGYEYEQIVFKILENGPQYIVRIFTLFSPSNNGLRGIQKRLNIRGIDIVVEEYRKQQYRELLNID